MEKDAALYIVKDETFSITMLSCALFTQSLICGRNILVNHLLNGPGLYRGVSFQCLQWRWSECDEKSFVFHLVALCTFFLILCEFSFWLIDTYTYWSSPAHQAHQSATPILLYIWTCESTCHKMLVHCHTNCWCIAECHYSNTEAQ